MKARTIDTDLDRSRLLHELFGQAPAGMAILDRRLRYLYVNEALAEINGVEAAEHVGRTLEEVVPEVAPAARPVLEGVLESGQPILDWELSGETAAAPGETHHWLESVYPLLSNGSVTALGAVVVDVTDRRRAENRLRQSERRFRALVDAMDDVVFTLDSERRHTGVWGNWLAREGVTSEDFIGRTAAEIMGRKRGIVHERQAERALRGEHVLYQWSARGGRRFQTSLSPLVLDGEIEGVVGVGREITQLRRVQEELATHQRRVEHLLERLESGLTPKTGSIPGWRTAWRYLCSDEEMLLGGDFLGVAPSAGGGIAFVIGDVAGRGPTAAGLGAALRAGWEALASLELEPPAILAALDRLLASYTEEPTFATVCCGLLSPGASVLTAASAGHHAPLVLSGTGISPLELEIGPALGVGTASPSWPENRLPFDSGSALLAITDGAFEGRRAPGGAARLGYQGLIELIPADRIDAGDLDGALEALLANVQALNGHGFDDDVAMLLLAPGP